MGHKHLVLVTEFQEEDFPGIDWDRRDFVSNYMHRSQDRGSCLDRDLQSMPTVVRNLRGLTLLVAKY